MTCRVFRAAILAVLLLLAACGRADKSEALVESRLPPGLATRYWPPEGWAWGLLRVKGEDDLIRYGVAAPKGIARADVIILPSHAESAEMWFETARDLIGQGYAVWILEGAGEGGSGRNFIRRDVAHVTSFDADIRALAALDRLVVRPTGNVVVIASGTAALPAMMAVHRGYRPDLLMLSGPFEPRTEPWKRPEPGAGAARTQAVAGWALANPDLRMGGVSRGWRKARRALAKELAEAATQTQTTPIRIIAPGADGHDCNGYTDCARTILPSRTAYAFADDPVRAPWLALVFSSLETALGLETMAPRDDLSPAASLKGPKAQLSGDS